VICWGDETGLSNQDQVGRSYAPKGRTPVVRRTARRITQSMISAVSNRGLMRFMLYEGALDVERFLGFLRRLVKDARQKLFLIVDNPKVHHARKVEAWLASHAHEVELFYLPAYAPEHNPDEYLNHALKQALRQKPQPDSKDELIRKERPLRAAHHPAVAGPCPRLLRGRAGPLRRLKCQVWPWQISSSVYRVVFWMLACPSHSCEARGSWASL
jgi:transposase